MIVCLLFDAARLHFIDASQTLLIECRAISTKPIKPKGATSFLVLTITENFC